MTLKIVVITLRRDDTRLVQFHIKTDYQKSLRQLCRSHAGSSRRSVMTTFVAAMPVITAERDDYFCRGHAGSSRRSVMTTFVAAMPGHHGGA